MKLPGIYISTKGHRVKIDDALKLLTNEFIRAGMTCWQTVLDLALVCHILKAYYDENEKICDKCMYWNSEELHELCARCKHLKILKDNWKGKNG